MCGSYDSLDLSLEEKLFFWGVDGLLGIFYRLAVLQQSDSWSLADSGGRCPCTSGL